MDIVQPGVYEENIATIETDFFRVSIHGGTGIQSIMDKKTVGEKLGAEQSMKLCEAENEGIMAFRI